MLFRSRILGLQFLFWFAGLSLSWAQIPGVHPWQSLTQMDLKTHFADQELFVQLTSPKAESPYVNRPFILEQPVFRLFKRSFKKPVLELKLLKAEYSLSKNRVLMQGSSDQPDLLLVLDLHDGTVYDPSHGLKTISEYFHLK